MPGRVNQSPVNRATQTGSPVYRALPPSPGIYAGASPPPRRPPRRPFLLRSGGERGVAGGEGRRRGGFLELLVQLLVALALAGVVEGVDAGLGVLGLEGDAHLLRADQAVVVLAG